MGLIYADMGNSYIDLYGYLSFTQTRRYPCVYVVMPRVDPQNGSQNGSRPGSAESA